MKGRLSQKKAGFFPIVYKKTDKAVKALSVIRYQTPKTSKNAKIIAMGVI
ncbi:hypothetical protein SAMN05192534_10896 [Alteribacillus persepolensis]|uniref:Uncharacterized protein n=1 Tax=Alteribacillus persepolensis TaxID=568899 RepID=A0A1G8E0V9_9BACI|nr:hypothetical protein SAMN05192534_10896 [Alteribacillus persepolensis]